MFGFSAFIFGISWLNTTQVRAKRSHSLSCFPSCIYYTDFSIYSVWLHYFVNRNCNKKATLSFLLKLAKFIKQHYMVLLKQMHFVYPPMQWQVQHKKHEWKFLNFCSIMEKFVSFYVWLCWGVLNSTKISYVKGHWHSMLTSVIMCLRAHIVWVHDTLAFRMLDALYS